jgi:ornithine cyclodeaminase/alanine dehydrogenase-like protein (mu-crystallin family)
MMRTGVMDSLVLQALGVKDVNDKRIIMFGSGNIASWSLRYLKEMYPNLKEIDVVNRSGKSDTFTQHASELGVTVTFQKKPQLELYDIIILHTSSQSGVLSSTDIPKIKKGAIITAYKNLHEHGELASEFFNTQKHNVIIDWPESLHAGDLQAAQEKGYLVEDEILWLTDILNGNKRLLEKSFTVFRSDGTPMQDAATLKLILKEQNNADE